MSVPLPKAVAGRSNTARRTVLLLLSGLLLSAPLCANANAQTVSAERPSRVAPYATFITEAAQRFGIPEHWIRAVMRVESAGDVRAISSAGAMGLMQVMPATWADLRARHRLGANPYDPRDNILAGAAYLREMHDRYGSPGFLAAYNAGPGRYEEYLAGRPLPLKPAPMSSRSRPLSAAQTRLLPSRSRPPIPTPGRARRCSSCNPSAPPPLFRRPAIARRMRPRLQLRCAMPQPSLRNPQACLSPETAMGGRDDGARSISWNSVLWRKDGGPRRESRQHNRTMAR